VASILFCSVLYKANRSENKATVLVPDAGGPTTEQAVFEAQAKPADYFTQARSNGERTIRPSALRDLLKRSTHKNWSVESLHADTALKPEPPTIADMQRLERSEGGDWLVDLTRGCIHSVAFRNANAVHTVLQPKQPLAESYPTVVPDESLPEQVIPIADRLCRDMLIVLPLMNNPNVLDVEQAWRRFSAVGVAWGTRAHGVEAGLREFTSQKDRLVQRVNAHGGWQHGGVLAARRIVVEGVDLEMSGPETPRWRSKIN